MNPYESAVRLGHRAYKVTLSPWIGRNCRFQPTCSDYAAEALLLHGPLRGGWLAARRLCRCQPLGGSGYDPVPPRCERLKTDDRSEFSGRSGATFRRRRERG
ncbi:MAG TPA: membrane protein insertion efficiency factor YidD [Caulobacteraceae bacterium]|nr:membrane protein insertion efficiency factor YidD [Caulobacteraceae bacterium]